MVNPINISFIQKPHQMSLNSIIASYNNERNGDWIGLVDEGISASLRSLASEPDISTSRYAKMSEIFVVFCHLGLCLNDFIQKCKKENDERIIGFITEEV